MEITAWRIIKIYNIRPLIKNRVEVYYIHAYHQFVRIFYSSVWEKRGKENEEKERGGEEIR